ncbi:AI-2E family transporter [Leptolyngbya sp. FACHB-36]|uniref:AI-2E family transporter n=1 Tax=Leptolyngbya sp. FACHB-36 TaxID=2692808 RepID=UPI0016805C15|nr:AI-2E family transporter [Leptolyngbya sp. FACHB-36]
MNIGQWIGFLALLASLYILWEIRQVLLLVFAAIVLANSLNLLAQRFQRAGLNRGQSVLLAVGSFLAVIGGFVWLIVPPFASQLQELIVLMPKGVDRADAWVNNMIKLVPSQFSPYLPDINSLGQQVQPVINRLLGGSLAFFSSSLGVVVNLLLVLVLALMMLVNPLAYRRVFIRLFPAFYRRRIDEILHECEFSLGRWIGGALISMSVVAVLSSTGLALIGVRAALAQGVLAGLLNFIPNIGPTLSVVLPMSIAVLDAFWKPFAVLGLYFVIQQFESNLLTPYVMAQQVALLPAVTLLAQVFFATIFGFLGLALALPLTVVSQIWIRKVLLEDVMDHWGGRDVDVSDVNEHPNEPNGNTPDAEPKHQRRVGSLTAPAPDPADERATDPLDPSRTVPIDDLPPKNL